MTPTNYFVVSEPMPQLEEIMSIFDAANTRPLLFALIAPCEPVAGWSDCGRAEPVELLPVPYVPEVVLPVVPVAAVPVWLGVVEEALVPAAFVLLVWELVLGMPVLVPVLVEPVCAPVEAVVLGVVEDVLEDVFGVVVVVTPVFDEV